MKKSFFILAVILVINQNMFSQDAEKKFTIQTSPFLWFSDIFVVDSSATLFLMDLEGQIKMNNSINLSLTLSFLLDSHTDEYRVGSDNRSKENVYQVNVKPMLVYRPFETGLKGFYLGFYPNIGFVYVENSRESQFYTEVGFGINWGYKWVFRRGFTMQVGNGLGKTFSFPNGSRDYITINSDGRISFTHTDIHLLDFKLGYSF